MKKKLMCLISVLVFLISAFSFAGCSHEPSNEVYLKFWDSFGNDYIMNNYSYTELCLEYPCQDDILMFFGSVCFRDRDRRTDEFYRSYPEVLFEKVNLEIPGEYVVTHRVTRADKRFLTSYGSVNFSIRVTVYDNSIVPDDCIEL